MWECEWRTLKKSPALKIFVEANFPRRYNANHGQLTTGEILKAVCDGTLFGLVECDVREPDDLRYRFPEMQPIFKNTCITCDDLSPFMRRYAEENDIMTRPQRTLVGIVYGTRILLATSLLRWNVKHGLVVDRVDQVVKYDTNPCFRRFGDSVSSARREGDADPDKAIITDTMKLQ